MSCMRGFDCLVFCLQAVYLSRNSLANLEGLEQFYRLQALSVSDNILETWQALAALTQRPLCASLQAASFDGNPISFLPNYRAQAMLRPLQSWQAWPCPITKFQAQLPCTGNALTAATLPCMAVPNQIFQAHLPCTGNALTAAILACMAVPHSKKREGVMTSQTSTVQSAFIADLLACSALNMRVWQLHLAFMANAQAQMHTSGFHQPKQLRVLIHKCIQREPLNRCMQ